MRKKTPRKQAFATTPRCIDVVALDAAEREGLAGTWHRRFARPEGAITAELGAGKGELALALAAAHPERNFLCMDVKPDRLYMGALQAEAAGLDNILFVRDEVSNLYAHFAPGELARIWLTFPDPYPRHRHFARRLTNFGFWFQYKQVLAPGGQVHFKTDDPVFFDYSVAQFGNWMGEPSKWGRIAALTRDLHAPGEPLRTPETGAMTQFERRFVAQGLPIHYLRVDFEGAAAE